jgi:hypothetical protein
MQCKPSRRGTSPLLVFCNKNPSGINRLGDVMKFWQNPKLSLEGQVLSFQLVLQPFSCPTMCRMVKYLLQYQSSWVQVDQAEDVSDVSPQLNMS